MFRARRLRMRREGSLRMCAVSDFNMEVLIFFTRQSPYERQNVTKPFFLVCIKCILWVCILLPPPSPVAVSVLVRVGLIAQ